jgi:hypothetical protein
MLYQAPGRSVTLALLLPCAKFRTHGFCRFSIICLVSTTPQRRRLVGAPGALAKSWLKPRHHQLQVPWPPIFMLHAHRPWTKSHKWFSAYCKPTTSTFVMARHSKRILGVIPSGAAERSAPPPLQRQVPERCQYLPSCGSWDVWVGPAIADTKAMASLCNPNINVIWCH